MESSMHAPKNSGRQHQKVGCSSTCTAQIEELTKMVHALEFRARNLEAVTVATVAPVATTTAPKPAQQSRRRAGSLPPRSAHDNDNKHHSHHGKSNGNGNNGANGVNRQTVDNPKGGNQPKADKGKGPQAQNRPQPQHQAQQQAMAQPQGLIVNGHGVVSATPVEKAANSRAANLPTNEQVKFMQTAHAEGMSRVEIVHALLDKWPSIHKGKGFTPAEIAAAQLALCYSTIDFSTSRWALKLS